MAYIGKQPIVGNFVKLDAITTSATATFNLTNGGVAYFPQSANNCIVSLNGVIQSPTSAYTISGSTIVFSDSLTSSDTIDFILVLGDVLSIGTPSDGTITSAKLASGTTGLISWQSVQTSGFTAVAGRGYPCNTTSAAFTVTLPSSATAGDTIILLDYARTWGTNKITINQNSLKFQGYTSPNPEYNTNGQSVTLVYVDSTKGWIPLTDDDVTLETPQSYSVDYLVIAGGGHGGTTSSGGWGNGGGGGAGGYRSGTVTLTPSNGTLTVTVGAGAGGKTSANSPSNGSDSQISGAGITTVTSAGGGYGGGELSGSNSPASGGSGGGGNGYFGGSGAGNTPSTTPSQGNSGGAGQNISGGTGCGGGGGGIGATGTSGASGGTGGNGSASSITGSSVTRAGGGGGCSDTVSASGGSGGGGSGSSGGTGGSGTVNTGSGGGAARNGNTSGGGGKGVVILSMPTASYSGSTTGSPTVTTSGSNTILTFNDSGSYIT